MTAWFRLPMLLRVAVILAVWFGYAVLVLTLNTAESSDRIAKWLCIACAVAAGVTAHADFRAHLRFGSTENYLAYRRALRTGELPADIEVGQWQGWLRGSGSWIAVAFIFGAPAVFFGAMSAAGSERSYRWLPGAAFAVLFVWGFAAMVRTNARIKRLTAAVRRRLDSLEQAAGAPVQRTTADELKRGGFEGPLTQRLLVGCLFLFAAAVLVLVVADLEAIVRGGPRIVPLPWAAAWAAIIAVAWIVLGEERDVRRNFATYEQYTDYNRTVRTGTMPGEVDPAVWRARLRTSRRENLFKLVAAGFLVGVGIASILTEQTPYRWVTASLFELTAIWILVNWWTFRVRLADLAAEVERHAIRQTWG